MTDDGIEVAEFLRARLQKNRIVLDRRLLGRGSGAFVWFMRAPISSTPMSAWRSP